MTFSLGGDDPVGGGSGIHLPSKSRKFSLFSWISGRSGQFLDHDLVQALLVACGIAAESLVNFGRNAAYGVLQLPAPLLHAYRIS